MLTFYISMLETEEQQDKFSYIYQNYVGFMYHVAKEVVKEHYLAEDVVHETFLQLIRIIDKVHIDDELTLRAFLRRVTHNKAVDCVRKWDKVRPTEDDELERYDTKHKQDPETIAIDAGLSSERNRNNFEHHSGKHKSANFSSAENDIR